MDQTRLDGQLDFQLYKILYDLAAAVEDCPDPSLTREIEAVLQGLQHKRFRVAVVGEFRRGKSSLINALLGMPILPVDIEPTTAAVNRITYGLKPGACIHYHDGRDAEVPIDRLSDYVTKLTREAAQVAATVREAEIRYPTELCANGIEILDTPGLNDTESMSAVTEGQLQGIHAALVVVKATMPYSDTECRWAARLMALPNLQHVIFVATCMDLVPPHQREKVIAYLTERIQTHTLQRVQADYGDQPEVLEKAEGLLKALRVHPVSAMEALDAFVSGDYDALAESRLPELKKELVTIFNAQLQLRGLYQVGGLVQRARAWFSTVSLADQLAGARAEMRAILAAEAAARDYFAGRAAQLQTLETEGLTNTQAVMEPWLGTAELGQNLRRLFINRLGAVTVQSDLAVAAALRDAEEDGQGLLSSLEDGLRKAIHAAALQSVGQYLTQRRKALERGGALLSQMGLPDESRLLAAVRGAMVAGLQPTLPPLQLRLPRLLTNLNVMNILVNPWVDNFVSRYSRAWREALPSYLGRVVEALTQTEPQALDGRIAGLAQQRMGAEKERCRQLRQRYDRAEELLRGAETAHAALAAAVAP